MTLADFVCILSRTPRLAFIEQRANSRHLPSSEKSLSPPRNTKACKELSIFLSSSLVGVKADHLLAARDSFFSLSLSLFLSLSLSLSLDRLHTEVRPR